MHWFNILDTRSCQKITLRARKRCIQWFTSWISCDQRPKEEFGIGRTTGVEGESISCKGVSRSPGRGTVRRPDSLILPMYGPVLCRDCSKLYGDRQLLTYRRSARRCSPRVPAPRRDPPQGRWRWGTLGSIDLKAWKRSTAVIAEKSSGNNR